MSNQESIDCVCVVLSYQTYFCMNVVSVPTSFISSRARLRHNARTIHRAEVSIDIISVIPQQLKVPQYPALAVGGSLWTIHNEEQYSSY